MKYIIAVLMLFAVNAHAEQVTDVTCIINAGDDYFKRVLGDVDSVRINYHGTRISTKDGQEWDYPPSVQCESHTYEKK